ncbi:Nucleotide-binding_alpha-beta plait domain superfamily [Hexamita inflata]|uniref:Nucleotide-binding alpha-beta plait domain superfamily n=1 Tax=Hexamita inflata TaxID=28002 RepID=A0AA86QXY2_9EUKA|nr:Nucleotide-binding alpha-beta plait domain superfamily [Hexamita inflata]
MDFIKDYTNSIRVLNIRKYDSAKHLQRFFIRYGNIEHIFVGQNQALICYDCPEAVESALCRAVKDEKKLSIRFAAGKEMTVFSPHSRSFSEVSTIPDSGLLEMDLMSD